MSSNFHVTHQPIAGQTRKRPEPPHGYSRNARVLEDGLPSNPSPQEPRAPRITCTQHHAYLPIPTPQYHVPLPSPPRLPSPAHNPRLNTPPPSIISSDNMGYMHPGMRRRH